MTTLAESFNPNRLRTAEDILSEMQDLTSSKNADKFNRAAEARFNSLLRMLELCRSDYGKRQHPIDGRPQSTEGLVAESFERHFRRTMGQATAAFFRCERFAERVISPDGSILEQFPGTLIGTRRTGAVTQMRDLSIALDSEEKRTYVGLNAGTGSAGGDTVPVGFIPQVFQAMKRTDQILEAAQWIPTATGNPTHLPSLTDTATSAVAIAEAAAQTFVNPTFGEISWPEATTWTSQAVKVSIALNLDSPVLAATLADCFRLRFARGFGASVVSTVVGDAPATTTSTSAGTVTQADLLKLMGAVDPQYAASDTSGWVMNWKTFLAIISGNLSSGIGDALYLLRKDANGHYLLYEKPVFVSNSVADIATGNVPVLFGDWSRLLIRNVPSEAVLRRYDELFMANNQVGYEMLFRADAEIMHAGGSGDDPIKGLTVS